MTHSTPGHTDCGHSHAAPPASALKQRGRRLTRQRAAIWEILTAAPDAHLGADVIAARVQALEPGVNASTVYRSLDVLVEEGLVRRTDLGTGRAVYEPAHEHLHHHLVCEICGSVTHVHDAALGDVALRLESQLGFRLGDREVTYFGTCAACPAAEA